MEECNKQKVIKMNKKNTVITNQYQNRFTMVYDIIKP